MADVNARIEQFRKMATDDPNNELGHYSLGQEYLRAGMYDEAILSFSRVLELKPDFSRAYQHSAVAMLKKGMRQEAVDRLTRGVRMAHERGDAVPKTEMIRMLQDLAAPVPELQQRGPERPVGEGEVHCVRCGQVRPKLPKPPFRNEQGQEIYEKICQPCWREWIAMGTKVINELRLPLNEPQAQKIYDQHMVEFLNLR